MHRQPCDICLSFMVYGFMVYLLPRRRIHKEEMPLQSWVVCSIEVEVSVIPRTAWSKACQRKETQYFPLLCSYQVPFQHVQYETDKMSGVCSRDSNCSALYVFCYILLSSWKLRMTEAGSSVRVWWHTVGDSRLPRKQSTWKPRGCPCSAAGHVTGQAFEPSAHSRLFK